MDRANTDNARESRRMTVCRNGIYYGTVSHKRLQPITHILRYRVASLLVDVEDLATGLAPSFLRYNRFGLFAIHDRDHGLVPGQSISDFAWDIVRQNGGAGVVTSVSMLCYPRMLGYGFNPLTTYYGFDQNQALRMVIYEVHNTFGGRHIYSTELFDAAAATFHKTEKMFRVSPFNGVEGDYGLRATVPGETLALGVALTTDAGAVLKAYFQGSHSPLTNGGLLLLLARMPLMTLKIIVGIHWEALKLWRKGLKLVQPGPTTAPVVGESLVDE
jgi:uncharacterized protein